MAAGLFVFGVVASAGMAINLFGAEQTQGSREVSAYSIALIATPVVALGAWAWLALRQMWRGRRRLAIVVLLAAYLLFGSNLLWLILVISGVAST